MSYDHKIHDPELFGSTRERVRVRPIGGEVALEVVGSDGGVIALVTIPPDAVGEIIKRIVDAHVYASQWNEAHKPEWMKIRDAPIEGESEPTP